MIGWRVTLGGRWVDTVFFQAGMSAADVRAALIGHDGFPPGIRVRRE